ncbi:uncharacterized protein LOC114270070 isoform X1 [Camellia sinensis]|uniref:uncharacterized protein LOC114270070 isoform X1 n=2 Tax=Camellia sinensis TaxID=4442 RepID=UPI001035B169|nr:uncharacterized protein LOC114270070 isoform X1 [Camellia sinensis]XP_028067267.1 uncharacterized protein LOC114270070 isoform X1 [Camellia sinensis]
MNHFCTCTGLASSVDLSRKRKQVVRISCKTCGRPLADALGPASASMLNTVGLQNTNFIDTKLSWKTVAKGSRSASRRSRKRTTSLNMGMQLDDKGTKREESSVSESEKLGVAVLGGHFADKIEHVPIKKRRFLLRSPSPPPRTPSPLQEEVLSYQPQTPFPQPEDSNQTIDSKCAPGQWCSDLVSNQEMGAFNGHVAVQFSQGIENRFVSQNLSDVIEKLDCTEDFSGIALLAAAACNNSFSDDAHNVKGAPICDESLTPEGIGSSISATPLERSSTSLETGSLLHKDSAHESNIDASLVHDDSEAVSQNFHNKKDCEEVGKGPASVKDERLHWDLNTVMEAWELPGDDQCIPSQINGLEGIPDDGSSEKPEGLEGGVIHREPELAVEQLKYSTADIEVPTQVVSKDKSLDNSSCSVSDPSSSRPISEEKINISPTNVVMPKREDCCGTFTFQLDKMVSIENVLPGKHDDVLLGLAVSEKVVCEIDGMQTKEDFGKTSCLPDNGIFPTELVSTVTCQMSDVEYSASKSGKAGPSDLLPEHEFFCALGTTFGEVQPVAALDVEKQDKEAPAADATLMGSSLPVELKELIPKSCDDFDRIAYEDPTDDGYGLDTSLGGHGHEIGVEKMTEIQAGYESPFEDGELRESLVYSWEENEVEGETECVDYDSDNRDADDLDAANQCLLKVGSDSCENVDNGNVAGKVMQRERANVSKESSHLVSIEKLSGLDQLPEGCECSTTNKTGEANNVSARKVLDSDSMDGLDVKGKAGEVQSKATKGSSCSDSLHRKDTVYMQRSRSSYDSCFRPGRVFSSEKSLGRDRPPLRIQDGSHDDSQWVDASTGYWDSRNHYPNNYHDAQGTGPGNVVANSGAKVDGSTYRDQRRSTNYSSKGMYRPLIRRRSPTDNDDDYGVHRRMVAARDNNHVRSRGRSGIYHRQWNIRGPREEYHGPMSDNPASSSVRLPHYLSRRERSFSPPGLSRGASFSRSRRKSRSRSRSPLLWRLQRERNMEVRRLSRSPDFRSEARMERIRRMPFQKPNFEADDEEIYMSPPRNRFSPPPCHSKWINDRNCVAAARFRERKSPGRLFGRNQRFDSVGSPRRMKSDDYFRSTIRPGRFTEMSGGAGRGHKYNGSDSDRTKHGDRYEMINRARRCDTGGVVRRFRYDAEDCFEAHNEERRDVARSAREARGPFRYNNNERMYGAGPKLSGIRGYHEDASPSRT